jgi:hypothetical protein
MGKFKDLTGKRFGRLLVIELLPDRKNNQALWRCKCGCGGIAEVVGGNLRRGITNSCGCLRTENITKHGQRHTIVYRKWLAMMDRCRNPNADKYMYYGGRGIEVCQEWHQPINFLRWAKGKWRKGLEIDRIDTNGDYTPENCRFVTRLENIINRRVMHTSETGYAGVSFNKRQRRFVSRLGLDYKRYQVGCFDSVEEAVMARNKFITDNNFPHKIQEIRCQE